MGSTSFTAPPAVLQAELADSFARAWVHREHHRPRLRDHRHRLHDLRERFRIVHVRRAVQRRERKMPLLHAHVAAGPGRIGLREQPDERVDHHVAHDRIRASAAIPSRSRFCVAAFVGREQVVRDRSVTMRLISSGMDAVESAKPRLHVRDLPDQQLLRHDAAGERRVHVSHHDTTRRGESHAAPARTPSSRAPSARRAFPTPRSGRHPAPADRARRRRPRTSPGRSAAPCGRAPVRIFRVRSSRASAPRSS